MADRKMTLKERAQDAVLRLWPALRQVANAWMLPVAVKVFIAGWHARGRAERLTKGCVVIPREVADFLCGAAPLDGKWFCEVDDANPKRRYWWRQHLRARRKA